MPNSQGENRTDNAGDVRFGSFERQLVGFVLNWVPFGGPSDEDCLPEFGMTAARLQDRCVRIVAAALDYPLEVCDRQLITRAARLLDVERRQIETPPSDDEILNTWVLRNGVRHWPAASRSREHAVAAPSGRSS